MTLEQAFSLVAAHLPDDFEIEVHIERGAGWVVLLIDMMGTQFTSEVNLCPDDSLAEQILDCLATGLADYWELPCR